MDKYNKMIDKHNARRKQLHRTYKSVKLIRKSKHNSLSLIGYLVVIVLTGGLIVIK